MSVSATGVISPTLFAEVTFGTGHNSIYIHDSAEAFTRENLGVSALPLLYPDAVQDDLPPWFQLSGRFGNQANYNSSQSPFIELQHDLRRPRQPDQGLGPAHVEGRHVRCRRA